MRTRSLTALLPLLLLTASCSDARDAASTVTDCAGLASDVARSGLAGVPTQAEAEAAVQRLDDRVQSLDSPEVRDAATDLRDRLRELQQAARAADPAAAAQAAERAREAARRTAQTCGLPADQFLGG
jgi:hypothetical protein